MALDVAVATAEDVAGISAELDPVTEPDADSVPERLPLYDAPAPVEYDAVEVGYGALSEGNPEVVPEASLLAETTVAEPEISEVRLPIVVNAVEIVVSAIETVNGKDEIGTELSAVLVKIGTAEVETSEEAVPTETPDEAGPIDAELAAEPDVEPDAVVTPLELGPPVLARDEMVSTAKEVTVVGSWTTELVTVEMAIALVTVVSDAPGIAKEYEGMLGAPPEDVGKPPLSEGPEAVVES